jgi:hypothetical protein
MIFMFDQLDFEVEEDRRKSGIQVEIWTTHLNSIFRLCCARQDCGWLSIREHGSELRPMVSFHTIFFPTLICHHLLSSASEKSASRVLLPHPLRCCSARRAQTCWSSQLRQATTSGHATPVRTSSLSPNRSGRVSFLINRDSLNMRTDKGADYVNHDR